MPIYGTILPVYKSIIYGIEIFLHSTSIFQNCEVKPSQKKSIKNKKSINPSIGGIYTNKWRFQSIREAIKKLRIYDIVIIREIRFWNRYPPAFYVDVTKYAFFNGLP